FPLSPVGDMEPLEVTLHSTRVLSDPRTLLALRDPLGVEPDTIHVWGFSLAGEAELVERCRSWLAAQERDRADRFVFARDRTRYTVAHGVLRHLLSLYLGVAPQALDFKASAAGKPTLQGGATLHFNLTHSEDGALLGVS